MSDLTCARRACWEAIAHWDGFVLGGKWIWRRFLTFDSGWEIPRTAHNTPCDHDEAPTAPADCPCLAITPASTVPSWYTNQVARIPYTLNMAVWVPGRNMELIETIAWELRNALYNFKPPGRNVPLVKGVTGHYPEFGGGFDMAPVTLGNADGPNGLRLDMPVVLPLVSKIKT